MTQGTVRPTTQGLYDPQYEHDACGVGFVVDIKGRKSHEIVQQALQVLVNLSHRGACGCDPQTGDGAGILLQIPHEFFVQECAKLGINLPGPGQYGVGVAFFSPNPGHREHCERKIMEVVAEEGQEFLGWRDVPVRPEHIGEVARSVMPVIRQFFVKKKGIYAGQEVFERKLYVIRKWANRRIKDDRIPGYEMFYMPSLSSRTVIYKGMLMSHQIPLFYPDLNDPKVVSALALVHSRFSTNTFPSWELAHPYRMIAHNGEINTLRGNRNWMRSRQATLTSALFGDEIYKLFPLVTETGSDSATFDNALEFLVMGGRPLEQAIMMMIPEAWTGNPYMDPDLRAFYEYHACLMEPWDGPAAIAFTDGVRIGAVLDRNGLRPGRYWVTSDDRLIYASETGVLDVPVENIVYKGKMQPGRMLLVDTQAGRIVEDSEIKRSLATRHPYRKWVEENILDIDELPAPPKVGEDQPIDEEQLLTLQQAFGYTLEDLRILMAPMAAKGEEAIGSMGNDAPLAVLSPRPQLLFNYFKQLFAQVTNPPIDSIREEMVMSTINYIGKWGNILDEVPSHARMVRVHHPIITNEQLEKLKNIDDGFNRAIVIPMLFDVREGEAGLAKAMDELCARGEQACRDGYSIIILSDRGVDENHAPIPSLLATAGLHHHLIREGLRGYVGIVVETGEAREIQHFVLLIGYGAGAINPYLAFDTIADMVRNRTLPAELLPPAGLTVEQAFKNFIKAADKAILKVIAKMGISTIQSYQGAQIFEAIGLNKEVIDRYFTHTASRIGGVGLDVIAREALMRHRNAFPEDRVSRLPLLDWGGQYQWRRGGEPHLFSPDAVFKLQHAVRTENYDVYKEYAQLINDQSEALCTLRGLFKFRKGNPIPIDEVEPVSSIVKRFATGAMSFGSISKEAHEALAIAMNELGGKSNTGEGGEDPERFRPDPDGKWRRSAIKQVASGRFGVTTNYLVNADELQIKMAQGAKPGEGGQLPGHKVFPEIARVRHSTPFVGLISPPPHHDIYSIEDLAQLIHDLKNVNPQARISVKLVAEVGVGTVAAGVAKAHADVVLISGHDGGTGASPLTSIKHAGIPWELGLAETQQTLVLNDLRSRIIVQVDGQMKTGRDVAIAALLGAEEWGFATAPLVALGCIMMRKCHLNTCPVGVATQDPVLRARFAGRPEYVINYFRFVAQELREIMAQLGFRTVDEMIGRTDMLEVQEAIDHWKARGLDFTQIFYQPPRKPGVEIRCVKPQDHGLEHALDHELIRRCKNALDTLEPVRFEMPIRNVNRTVGAMLSGEAAKRYGEEQMPPETIHIKFTGSAGQSFGVWLYGGITFELEGDANDYFGKGLSGGRLIVYPPRNARFVPEENIIIGNTCLYGATSGEAYVRGRAGERFAVRNSGAKAVVEGVGDHGCEYMTGGTVVVIGPTGRNFAAGMSGGIAFVWDVDGKFETRCNKAMVDLEPVSDEKDIELLKLLLTNHEKLTGSTVARRILDQFEATLPQFVKIMPKDFRRALSQLDEEERARAEAKLMPIPA
ncbi:MAG: glutamate synthase large subunit [Candidatus Hydrogenedentota bacterium]|jgi:glutamate synthase domain-containing protein 2/glutamate synthase domain-containing protein 1/glutamate synthase domain-containing protein 3|uniref:Glutamate synthase [NADPH] large chain n=1 Tax=Sumerlaea chitinivorans TaxID=2250252 RepID=A0A2Z4Y6D2_SUMC1|nr:Glutamate synthase [NADPH] large chain [Candidatus Sumerlaea chitinivorans]MCX7963420.1 glutamate synthase large subunit [Candidatus Sumerlaea chitinivorans]RMH24279.1 MAG: glutamate synthase large subunit [Candidatus Hydrogenedentota bacterium]GIX45023.1 MAG: glutamate synthase [Candidatus Sumerlaea sp.]